MSLQTADSLDLRTQAVAKKKPDDPPKRHRARDLGEVVPLGIEIAKSIADRAEVLRKARRWSKRTLVEEALKALCDSAGIAESSEGDAP